MDPLSLSHPEIGDAISLQRLQMLDQIANQQAMLAKARTLIAGLQAENTKLKEKPPNK